MDSSTNPASTKALGKWLLLTGWLGYTVVLGALYSRLPPSSDDSVFDYIGWAIGRGRIPYVDAADNNWPGIFYFHAISTALFGRTPWSWHILDYLWLIAACGMLFVFVRRAFGPGPALVVVPLYQAMYVSQNALFSGQRDILAAPLLLLAVYSTWRRMESGRWPWMVLQGLCVGWAVLIRPTFLIVAPLLALADLLYLKKTGRTLPAMIRDHAISLGCTLAFLGLVALLGWRSGALREWYRMAVEFNLVIETGVGESKLAVISDFLEYARVSWHWMLVLAIVSAFTHWRTRSIPTALLGTIGIATTVSALVQGKGYAYHWGPLYPLLAIAMAPLIFEALVGIFRDPSRVIYSRAVHRTLCAAACFLVALGMGRKMWSNLGDAMRWYAGSLSTREFYFRSDAGDMLPYVVALEVSDFVEKTVPADRSVLYWGQARTINYLSGRRTIGRFASIYPLTVPCGPRAIWFDVYSGLFPMWEHELKKCLAEDPPELMLLQTSSGPGEKYWCLAVDRKEPKLGYLLLDSARRDYVLERVFGSIECWRRKPR